MPLSVGSYHSRRPHIRAALRFAPSFGRKCRGLQPARTIRRCGTASRTDSNPWYSASVLLFLFTPSIESSSEIVSRANLTSRPNFGTPANPSVDATSPLQCDLQRFERRTSTLRFSSQAFDQVEQQSKCAAIFVPLQPGHFWQPTSESSLPMRVPQELPK